VTNQYGRGTVVERKIVHHLADDGYVLVRSAGSKGKVDVLGVKPRQILFVQSKITGRIDGADWDRLLELASWVNAVPLLAEYDLDGGCQQIHPSRAKKPRRCGIRFTRLLGAYQPRTPMRLQACGPWVSDEVQAAVEAPAARQRELDQVLVKLADEVGDRATPFAAGVRTALTEIREAIA